MKRLIFAFAFIAALCGQSVRPASALCLACSCTVHATSMTFPSYQFTGSDTTSATMNYSCTGTAGLTVAILVTLSAGHGTFAQRVMTGPSSTQFPTAVSLDYQLYTPLGQVFGDGTSGTSYYSSSSLLGVLGLITGGATANGTIPANQSVVSGQYGDSLIETISF